MRHDALKRTATYQRICGFAKRSIPNEFIELRMNLAVVFVRVHPHDTVLN
jgi:hypothetical protein